MPRRLTALIPTILLLLLCVPRSAGAAQAPAPDDAAPSVNAFAVDLYGALRRDSGNLVFSPAAIATGFAMAYAGARGQTAAEMAGVFHFDLPVERLNPAMSVLLRRLRLQQQDGVRLGLASAIWAAQDAPMLETYRQPVAANYGDRIEMLEFASGEDYARGKIDAWVADQTQGQVRQLALKTDRYTRLVVASALSMRADWAAPFARSATAQGVFLRPSGRSRTPLMSGRGAYAYLDEATFQAVALPYRGGELSMVILLPKTRNGLRALEAGLTAARLTDWLERLAQSPRREVAITLPKFALGDSLDLAPALRRLGLNAAFRRTAEFTGMTREPVQISEVVHRSFLSLDERGTDPAAPAAASPAPAAAPAGPPPTVFRADHAFLFLVKDNRTGAIQFMGRLADPRR